MKRQQVREADPLVDYVPHPVQERFHRSQAKVRMMCGGNRLGKTHAGCVEDIWFLSGRHPYREVPVPCKGLLICEDFPNATAKIIVPKLQALMPMGLVKKNGWRKNQQGIINRVECTTNSILDIMVHEQARNERQADKFEGGDYDFVHFDEPPPRAIWISVLRGLVDRDGSAHFCMTPLKEPWIFDELWLPGLHDGGFAIDFEKLREESNA